jgi:hypothetical protein
MQVLDSRSGRRRTHGYTRWPDHPALLLALSLSVAGAGLAGWYGWQSVAESQLSPAARSALTDLIAATIIFGCGLVGLIIYSFQQGSGCYVTADRRSSNARNALRTRPMR